jgi:hypothetical protein
MVCPSPLCLAPRRDVDQEVEQCLGLLSAQPFIEWAAGDGLLD